MMSMMPWFGALTWLLYALLLILAAAGVAALVASVRIGMAGPGPGEEILRMRYASGDIDTDEYRARLAVLHSSDGTAGEPPAAPPGRPRRPRRPRARPVRQGVTTGS